MAQTSDHLVHIHNQRRRVLTMVRGRQAKDELVHTLAENVAYLVRGQLPNGHVSHDPADIAKLNDLPNWEIQREAIEGTEEEESRRKPPRPHRSPRDMSISTMHLLLVNFLTLRET